MRFWVDWNSKSRAEQLFYYSRWATFLCRQARPARQLSPDTGQHSVPASPALARRL
ncbi:hypothetical protein A2U01_0056904, partial [Trifolium medium]|nr:hypothetical protein [Trifolium medium]